MGSGAPGNAATRVEAFMYSKGVQSFLKDPDIDQWFEQQSRERTRPAREALLHQIQQKVYDEASFMPIWQLDVHFISSLPVILRSACKAWVDRGPVQIVAAE